MTKPIAVIVGAGSKHDKDGTYESMPATARWGLGGALGIVFAQKYHVVLMGRRENILKDVAKEVAKVGEATPIVCDVANEASVKEAFDAAKKLGDIETVVFNVAPGFPKGFDFSKLPTVNEVPAEYLSDAFNVGVTGCLRVVQQVLDDFTAKKSGTILISGATMALRGGKGFAFMSPIKFALRSLAQSLFQEYAPLGIHTAHVIIDGVILSPNTQSWPVQHNDPKDLADAFLYLTSQPPSCWSQEIQLTPNTSSIGMRL